MKKLKDFLKRLSKVQKAFLGFLLLLLVLGPSSLLLNPPQDVEIYKITSFRDGYKNLRCRFRGGCGSDNGYVPKTNPINWNTRNVNLKASHFAITADNQTYYAYKATDFKVSSSLNKKNSLHITLNATWTKNNNPMQLIIFFFADDPRVEKLPGPEWGIEKIKFFNGKWHELDEKIYLALIDQSYSQNLLKLELDNSNNFIHFNDLEITTTGFHSISSGDDSDVTCLTLPSCYPNECELPPPPPGGAPYCSPAPFISPAPATSPSTLCKAGIKEFKVFNNEQYSCPIDEFSSVFYQCLNDYQKEENISNCQSAENWLDQVNIYCKEQPEC